MSSIIPIEIRRRTDKLAHQTASALKINVKRVLSKKRFKNEGILEDSIEVVVKESTPTEAAKIYLKFAPHGKLLELRKMTFTKMPPLEEISNWLNTKNLRLKSIPGYRQGVTPGISIEKQRERVAFAIARKKRFDDKHKRQRWKKEALSDVLTAMNRRLIDIWVDKTEEIIAKDLTTK